MKSSILMKSFLFFVVASLFLYSCQPGNSKQRLTEEDSTTYHPNAPCTIPENKLVAYRAGIENFYQKYLVRSGFNGGILVAKGGYVVYEKYHGFYDLRKKDSLTPHSAFHLASVSKTFTAMAILKLIQDGKLSLNDSLQKFFPGFPYEGVTVKLLLSHRSGLPNYLYFMEDLGWPRNVYCTNEDVLQYLMKYKPAGTGRPDTHFSYCNTNYSLLGLIVEKASGMSYEDYLKKTFFIPLGMKDTYVFNMARDSVRAMRSYDYRGRLEPYTFLDQGFGDKNVYSTPEDMLKWDQSMYTNQIFSKQTLEEAYTPYSNERPGIRNYGFGWRMNIFPDGKKVIYHNGWWHGNNTVFIRSIQDSLTIIVLGNKYDRNIYQAKKIAEVFEGGREIKDE